MGFVVLVQRLHDWALPWVSLAWGGSGCTMHAGGGACAWRLQHTAPEPGAAQDVMGGCRRAGAVRAMMAEGMASYTRQTACSPMLTAVEGAPGYRPGVAGCAVRQRGLDWCVVQHSTSGCCVGSRHALCSCWSCCTLPCGMRDTVDAVRAGGRVGVDWEADGNGAETPVSLQRFGLGSVLAAAMLSCSFTCARGWGARACAVRGSCEHGT